MAVGLVKLPERKHVVQIRVETFDKQIDLCILKLVINVCRQTETVGSFFFQIVSKNSDQTFTTDNADVQIFVKGLWRTESSGIACAQVDILSRIEAYVGTRTENYAVHKIVFVKSASDEKTPAFVFPFILEKQASDSGILPEVTVVAEDDVFQSVMIVFRTKSQV